MSQYHIPVQPVETIKYLNVQKGQWYVDCNLGGGGHTELILKAGGNVIGIDLDADAIVEVTKNHQTEIDNGRLILYQSNFSHIDEVVAKTGKKISGVFFDLGVSTHQLDTAERGFSFRGSNGFNNDAVLDMRMDQSLGATAKDLVNGLYEKELADIFWTFGEENFSRPIAKRIVEYRKTQMITTTDQLAKIILSVRRRSPSDRTHPATRIFQALRIAVNNELGSLEEALPKAFSVLDSGGRIVVLSFHSLEDRIVKDYFKSLEENKFAEVLTKKPVETSEQESLGNPRSRSAKLRAIQKI